MRNGRAESRVSNEDKAPMLFRLSVRLHTVKSIENFEIHLQEITSRLSGEAVLAIRIIG